MGEACALSSEHAFLSRKGSVPDTEGSMLNGGIDDNSVDDEDVLEAAPTGGVVVVAVAVVVGG
jgi:hypothetical protein